MGTVGLSPQSTIQYNVIGVPAKVEKFLFVARETSAMNGKLLLRFGDLHVLETRRPVPDCPFRCFVCGRSTRDDCAEEQAPSSDLFFLSRGDE
jgi:hypothetical protein